MWPRRLPGGRISRRWTSPAGSTTRSRSGRDRSTSSPETGLLSMSEARTPPVSLRRGAAVALALASIALAPVALGAQQPPSEEELARRMEELGPRYLAADAAADSAERAGEMARAAAIEQD